MGGFGDDTLAADYNDKLISGGEGTDKLVLLDDIAREHTSDYKIDLERNELSYLETSYYDDGRLNGQLIIKTEIDSIEDVIGSSLSETIIGNDSENYLDGDGGNDTIYGGAGEDLLSGGLGNDQLYGGSDNDILIAGLGNDFYDGEVGIDYVDYQYLDVESYGVSIYFNLSTAKIDAAGANENFELINASETLIETDLLVSIENIIGSNNADYVKGNWDGNLIYGRGGDDTIDGGDNTDYLEGQAGNDELIGGQGNDTLKGGSGDDHLSGGTDDDHLTGGSGDDHLSGGTDDDHLTGGSGDDYLSGGTGDDYLDGQLGQDILYGDDGDDQLLGWIR